MSAKFTQAQQEALQKVFEIIGEHFDGALVVVNSEADDGQSRSITNIFWTGGYLAALGMTEAARQFIVTASYKVPEQTP